MKNSRQPANPISKAPSRVAPIALAFVVVLASAAIAAPSAQAQTFTLLYSFQGPPYDGAGPEGPLTFDGVGNLYGTTVYGGGGNSSGLGTLFELDTSGKETVLHTFGKRGDGTHPTGALVRFAGNTYGTTIEGGGTGCNSTGCGTVFELSGAKETIVFSFPGVGGNFPAAGLSRDAAGNFYGTTAQGGPATLPPACPAYGCGTVFKVSQGQESLLYSFSGKPDGSSPGGNLIVDASGNLYGTTEVGGTFDEGTVFELSPNSDGTWMERILYNFTGKSDGGEPTSGVVIDAKGNLYGTTVIGGLNPKSGGAQCPEGCGVVFKLTKNLAGTWTERALHRFAGPPGDGKQPFGNLVRDKQGNLYGVTETGGTAGWGTVFELSPSGDETLLHIFTGGATDGENPTAGLVMDASGNLYGTTSSGGAGTSGAFGIVFKITP